jgi:hypothetical protein
MGCNYDINSLFTDDFVKDLVVIRCVEGIVEERAFERKLRGLINNEAGGSCLPPADMEMGNMYFATFCQFLENVMVAGWNRVMNIVLRGNKEDFHFLRFRFFIFSLDNWIILSLF